MTYLVLNVVLTNPKHFNCIFICKKHLVELYFSLDERESIGHDVDKCSLCLPQQEKGVVVRM